MTTTTPLKTYEVSWKVSLMHDASMKVKAPAGLSEEELKSYIRENESVLPHYWIDYENPYDYELGLDELDIYFDAEELN